MAGAFDIVIVGGGTAGAALAARLSEDAGCSVCLLEAGGSERTLAVRVPAGMAAAIHTPRLNWGFASEPQAGMNGRSIPLPRGRALGGSGSINGMVYFRGHPRDFDDWARMGAKGWSYREVLPYFTRSEANEDFPASVFHGDEGEINIREARRPNPLNFDFFAAMRALQYRHNPDFNAGDSEGFGLRQTMVRDGERDSSARSMLRPAMRRLNLSVVTGARAAAIAMEGRRATGVRLIDGRSFTARREVVLCAGAVQSPHLLMLSGIGPAQHLQDHGIAVVRDLPGVGGNLHDHVGCAVQMETDDPTSYGLSWRSLPKGALALAQYALLRTGPFAAQVFESAAFLRTAAGLDRPDVQLVFQPARRTGAKLPVPVGHGYGIAPVNLYPKARGRIVLASGEAGDAPLIDPNFLGETDDIAPLIRGVKIARTVFAQESFARYRASELAPGNDVRSDEEIAAWIRATGYSINHACGSCRMGEDADAVVDSELRVRGIDGLRIADASVFPLLPGGNCNAAALMVGEKAADLIRGRTLAPAQLPEDINDWPKAA